MYGGAVYTGGFRGALNWAPMMPRDASLSVSFCFSSVGKNKTFDNNIYYSPLTLDCGICFILA